MSMLGRCTHRLEDGSTCLREADCTFDKCHEHAVQEGLCFVTLEDEPWWTHVVGVLAMGAVVCLLLGGAWLLVWLLWR